MEEEGTAGSIQAPPATRRRLAKQSLQWNVTNSPDFCKYFPQLVEKARQQRSTGGDNTTEEEDTHTAQAVTGTGKKLGVEWIVIFALIAAMGLYRVLQDVLS